MAQLVKNLPALWETRVQSLGWEDPLEKGMATHSSILAWRNPMNRGARWATVYGIAKIRKRLVTITFTFFFHLVLGYWYRVGLPRWLSGKESACWHKRCGFYPWVEKIPWRRKWQPNPVFLPGEFHRQRSLAGYSPRGRKESDMTERLSLTYSVFTKGQGSLVCCCVWGHKVFDTTEWLNNNKNKLETQQGWWVDHWIYDSEIQ